MNSLISPRSYEVTLKSSFIFRLRNLGQFCCFSKAQGSIGLLPSTCSPLFLEGLMGGEVGGRTVWGKEGLEESFMVGVPWWDRAGSKERGRNTHTLLPVPQIGRQWGTYKDRRFSVLPATSATFEISQVLHQLWAPTSKPLRCLCWGASPSLQKPSTCPSPTSAPSGPPLDPDSVMTVKLPLAWGRRSTETALDSMAWLVKHLHHLCGISEGFLTSFLLFGLFQEHLKPSLADLLIFLITCPNEKTIRCYWPLRLYSYFLRSLHSLEQLISRKQHSTI